VHIGVSQVASKSQATTTVKATASVRRPIHIQGSCAAPVRGSPRARTSAGPVNLIAVGFVDTALPASLLGNQLDERRSELRATAALPIRRVVTPADVAALAVHIMTNTALTGATYDIDGGQQFI
jgi:hypothetical protein